MRTNDGLVKALTAALMVLAMAAARGEPPPKAFGSYKAWQAVSYMDEGRKTCYIISRPEESRPKNANRGDIYLMVSRQAGSRRDRVSLRVGYPFQEDTSATIRIGTQAFLLNTGDKYAWPPEAADTQRLVQAMRAGREMTVEGESTRGTKTMDRFSLLGFTAAHKAISRACR